MAAAGSSLNIGVPSPPPPAPMRTSQASPAAAAGRAPLFIPPSNNDGTTSYLQVCFFAQNGALLEYRYRERSMLP